MSLYYRQWNDLDEEDINEEKEIVDDFYQEEASYTLQECPYCSHGCNYCLMTRGL